MLLTKSMLVTFKYITTVTICQNVMLVTKCWWSFLSPSGKKVFWWHFNKSFLSLYVRMWCWSPISYVWDVIRVTSLYARMRCRWLVFDIGELTRHQHQKLVTNTSGLQHSSVSNESSPTSMQRFILIGSSNKGDIDIGDGCWRPNVLVTSLRCWWPIQDVGDRFNTLGKSPT